MFLLYFFSQARLLPLSTLLGTFWYGLRLDASAAAYVCAVPFLLFVLDGLLRPRLALGRVVDAYSAVVGTVLVVLIVADLALYHAWGFRLDDTPLQYLASPDEALATSGSAPLGRLFTLIAGGWVGGWWLYKKVVGPLPKFPAWFGRGRAALAGLLATALLVLPMRGGTQQIPINQSVAYFSAIAFANHAAVNPIWNVVSALLRRDEERPMADFMPPAQAQNLVAGYYPLAAGRPAAPADTTASLLSEPRPNVLFIILESFTAKLVGSVGGEPGIIPTLDSLAGTGILFNHLYAAGDRSQKGLVALLSGYPNQPTTSIIKYPRKTQTLPYLCRSLHAAGYHSAYYYGGELSFANMGSYLRTSGYERLVERENFAAADQNSKWGAHDHVLFNRILTDLKTQPQPFFVTAFTLSSHEPFEVPMKPVFPGTTEADLFRNSVHYTDKALGQFLRQAHRQPWYAHTLLVLVADHGHPQPGNSPNDSPAKFHIPLVLAGGALRAAARGRVVPVIGSQTDVAATLLHQLGLPATEYAWSRDLLNPTAQSLAFYCYTDGFGLVSPQGTVTFDNVSRQVTARGAAVPASQVALGQAFEQVSWADFLKR